ncbi:MAG TPA: GNAT family N-acetyltransferase [Chitinophagaceae bacterium]|nr:GNAT family N-acetyltransferase [Chitinophagaceae bacterium]
MRSAVVDSAYRGHGLAAALLQHLLVAARQQGISVIYLLTTTAAPYFANKGFTAVAKDDVPSALLQSKEFNGLCPSTATIMFRRVE